MASREMSMKTVYYFGMKHKDHIQYHKEKNSKYMDKKRKTRTSFKKRCDQVSQKSEHVASVVNSGILRYEYMSPRS